MQPKSNAAAELTAYFDSGEYGHASRIIDLVLKHSPSGESVHLQTADDDARSVVNDAERRAGENQPEGLETRIAGRGQTLASTDTTTGLLTIGS